MNKKDVNYKHKTFNLNRYLKLHRLFITKNDYLKSIVRLEFVIYFLGKYFSLPKIHILLINQDFLNIAVFRFIKQTWRCFFKGLRFRTVLNQIAHLCISERLSLKCPRSKILKGVTKILLNEESAIHFYELKDRIHHDNSSKTIARYKYLKLLFYDMWLLNIWSEKIWLPYLSKIWYPIETLFY